MTMKNIAILLVMVGVGLAAAFGARNVDAVMERQGAAGAAKLLGGHAAELEGEAANAETPAARKAEIASEMATLAPRVEAATMKASAIPKEAVPARERLSGWFSANGLPFSAGVVLIVLGGILARRADKAAASSDAPEGSGNRRKEAVDFGHKLRATAAAVRTLQRVMKDEPARSVPRLTPLREQVEAIVRDDIEHLVETKPQVIARYGMAGFAALFGPLSGAERYLNRAWVAMVDRHWDEAEASLESAASQLEATVEALKGLQPAA